MEIRISLGRCDLIMRIIHTENCEIRSRPSRRVALRRTDVSSIKVCSLLASIIHANRNGIVHSTKYEHPRTPECIFRHDETRNMISRKSRPLWPSRSLYLELRMFDGIKNRSSAVCGWLHYSEWPSAGRRFDVRSIFTSLQCFGAGVFATRMRLLFVSVRRVWPHQRVRRMGVRR